MTKLQRVRNIFVALVMLMVAAVMLYYGAESFLFVVTFLAISILASGVGTLFYYFTMARYTVGGKTMLYKGVILLEIGLFTWSINDVPRVYILIYLAAIHAFSGLVEVLRARETGLQGFRHYKLKLTHGIVDIAMALCCLLFIGSARTAVNIYCAGVAYSALMRIITACRRAPVYHIS